MKKKFSLFFLVSLFVTFSSNMATAQVVESDIQYWVGTGSNSAVLVVNWDFAGKAIVWGYRWNGNDEVVLDLLNAIQQADSRLSIDNSGGFIDDFVFTDNCRGLSLSGWDSDDFGYWMYALNSSLAGLGAAAQPLTNGDEVYWKYCSTDYNVGAINASIDLTYIDNTAAVITLPITATLCPNESYTDNGFNINTKDYSYQEEPYIITRSVQMICAADTVYNLTLFINKTDEIFDTLSIHTADLPYTYGEIVIGEETQSDIYTYYLTNNNGCDSTIHLSLNVLPSTVGIDTQNQNKIIIYNRENSILTVESLENIAQIRIVSLIGTVIFSQHYNQPVINLNTNILPKGVYIIQIELNSGLITTQKIIL